MGHLLPGGLVLCKFNSTSHSTAMQPSVSIDPKSFSMEFSQVGWSVDGFEQREEP